jgi:hypothetical protein
MTFALPTFLPRHMLFLVLVLIIDLPLSAQENERIHRLGVRGAYKSDNVDMWGAEASYQLYLKGIRRLEMDFGTMSSSTWDILQATVIYQWCFLEIGGLTLYAGPGLGIGYASYGYAEDEFFGVIAGNIGIDYTFKFPIQLALDYRPEYSAWQQVGKELTNQVAFAVRLAF